jgi:hypothetical protein
MVEAKVWIVRKGVLEQCVGKVADGFQQIGWNRGLTLVPMHKTCIEMRVFLMLFIFSMIFKDLLEVPI